MYLAIFATAYFIKASIPELIDAIPDGVFKVADSQVASRWGNITEFNGFDLITPNEKEARFALADQDSNIGRLISETKEAAQCKNILLKLGSRGVFFLQDGLPYSIDSFANNVKDAVGAGDALLAYATLTMLATKSLPMACIIGSMAAACECEIDGNIPVRPEVRYCRRLNGCGEDSVKILNLVVFHYQHPMEMGLENVRTWDNMTVALLMIKVLFIILDMIKRKNIM